MNRPQSSLFSDRLAADSEASEPASDPQFSLVYDQLRLIARDWFRDQPQDHTLQPTALVHEAYLKLARSDAPQSRSHFVALAATAMRQILVSHARRRRSLKRGGNWSRVQLDGFSGSAGIENHECSGQAEVDIEALHESLERLAELSPRQSRVVEMRYFGGLSVEEVAAVLEVSPRTIKLDWQMARSWLYRDLQLDRDEERLR